MANYTRPQYLMSKDIPVAKITGFYVEVLRQDLLPLAIRTPDVDFDRIFHGWIDTRIMSMGRSNSDKIMDGFRLPRSNPYAAAAAMHFTSLSDCYWIRQEGEETTWDDVSLYRAGLSTDVAETSLFGKRRLFHGRIHTPETSTAGLSAKAWYRDGNQKLWLYKIGKKELAASRILEAIGADHVPYMNASNELERMADEAHIQKIRDMDEKLVKCPIITNEARSIAAWYDFEEHCEDLQVDPYAWIGHDPGYHEMQVCDYILNNPDRHGENWGFFMDADTGKVQGLHPLFDHDHAFSEEMNVMSQTTRHEIPLRKAALLSLPHAKRLRLKALLSMPRPEELTVQAWTDVQQRASLLVRERDRGQEEER